MGINELNAKCGRCGYEWLRRKERPKQCPDCKSPYWDKPRERAKRVVKASKVVSEVGYEPIFE
jgi:DNA-directed RNA polymerase subunit RPC12/RpoP